MGADSLSFALIMRTITVTDMVVLLKVFATRESRMS